MWNAFWWSVSFFTVFCKSNANEIRRISLFVLAISRRKYKWKFDRKFEAFLSDISFEQDASSLNFRDEVKIRGGKRLFDQ